MPSAYEGTDIISYLQSKYIMRRSRISYRIGDISLKHMIFRAIICYTTFAYFYLNFTTLGYSSANKRDTFSVSLLFFVVENGGKSGIFLQFSPLFAFYLNIFKLFFKKTLLYSTNML
jgi:hypothetical protein